VEIPADSPTALGDRVDPIESEVAELRHLLAAGDLGSRAACRAGLDRLRALWRRSPDLFVPDTVRALQQIAGAVRAPVALDSEGAHQALKAVFGYDRFRPGQEEIIAAVLAGRDCIGVMPTGAGKSLTYQLPARLLGGTTLVVSPLIALMKDQVDAMNEAGLRATYLNSSLTPDERRERLAKLWAGEYELVYAAPEGLEAGTGAALARMRLALIAIDEAHCISAWGHDFRPAYRNLAGLKRRFAGAPVLALTATATREVMRDIVDQLAMVDPAEYRGSFYRPNLRLCAYRKGDGGPGGAAASSPGGERRSGGVRNAVLRLIQARRRSNGVERGIVYCLSRKSADGTAEFLRAEGIAAVAYHAGLDPAERNRAQEAFRRDQVDVVVATVAFGMGIDKPDIRYVIHRDMPRSVEGYYQEIGRAGRDGLPSDCVLFYSWADVLSYDRMSGDGSPEIGERQREQAREMFRLADERRRCRHQAVTGYLGEAIAPCGSSCDLCSGTDLLAACAPAARDRRRRGGGRGQPGVDPAGDMPAAEPAGAEDPALLARLKQLRRALAEERHLPAYIVFPDATLLEMATRRPTSADELLAISGVGPKKLAQYGDAFLALLRRSA
jgi:ATP-dependent DNA helicase RecQ